MYSQLHINRNYIIGIFDVLMGKERANRKAISNDTPKIFRKKEDMKE